MRRLSLFFVLVAFLSTDTSAEAQQKKILVSSERADLVEDLKTASPLAQIVPVTQETVMQEIGDADAFIGRITPEQVRAGKNLKWVGSMSAGVEGVLHLSGGTDLRDSDIILTNNQIVQGPEIGDHAMGMLLTLSRDIDRFLEDQRHGRWEPRPYAGIELNGRTAVIVGVGGIGTQIAFRAWGHGMSIIGVDPDDIPFMPIIQRVVKPDQLDDVLPLADVVFMAAPHTPQSDKMIGAKQFGLMKDGAYFIAVSRGKTYELDALVDAVKSGHLAGAGVDVTDPEPPARGSSAVDVPRTSSSPHTSPAARTRTAPAWSGLSRRTSAASSKASR